VGARATGDTSSTTAPVGRDVCDASAPEGEWHED
jgi:hypothetical protein